MHRNSKISLTKDFRCFCKKIRLVADVMCFWGDLPVLMRAPVKFKLLSDGVKHFLTEAVVGFLAGSSSDWG